uniref:Uncharacterized protein n=1 Tax=Ochrobactrum phage ORM_20 TaxID=2985243 RepID=A0A9N6ZG90_9VIRU|nr:hypothetical protein ORM20_00063 [Ochrobactrum phage ORM_20]
MITSAKYTEGGSIIAVIDGVEMTVPDDMANRHRVMLAEWEKEGNEILPYEQQETIVEWISSRQFKVGLSREKIYEAVVAWVNTQDIEVQIAFETSHRFFLDDDFLQAGFDQMGYSEEEAKAFFLKYSKI